MVIGMGILFDVASATPLGNFAAPVELIGLAYFALSLGLNLILTGMIVYRIWSHQRAMKKMSDCDLPYTSVTTMFVESAALYTIALIPLLVTFALTSPYSQIFLGIAPSVQVSILLKIMYLADDFPCR